MKIANGRRRLSPWWIDKFMSVDFLMFCDGDDGVVRRAVIKL
jgi:hypothetical protein